MSEFNPTAHQLDPVVWNVRTSGLALLACMLLFGITATLFWSACDGQFLDWDDVGYVTKEPNVLNGISINGLIWAAKAVVVWNWHPLTMLSLQLDAQLFGPGPYGFHRTAVLIHSVNAALVFLTILTLSGSHWESLLVALLFAIHPLRVESVAWVSERKDVLSGFFFLLTILSYAYYANRPSVGRYVLVATSLVLGLSSKSMLVTTPCVLLLLDFWPLARVRNFSATEFPQMRRLILEKIPLFGLSVIFSVITTIAQESAMSSWPLSYQLKNSTISYVVYIGQTFWPINLSPHYGRHEISFFYFLGALTLLLVMTSLAVWQRNQRPYLFVGWFWYLGMLVPVIGLIQVGQQLHADRYTYLPQIGLLLAIVWSAYDFALKSSPRSIVMSVVAAVCLVGGSYLTIQQIAIWKNTETLWEHVYRLEPENKLSIQHLTGQYFRMGKKEAAIRMSRELIRISNAKEMSDMVKLVEVAMLLADTGEHDVCVQVLDSVLEFYPERADLISNRGKAEAAQGKWQEAANDFRRAADLSPNSASYSFYLAHALEKLGQNDESHQIIEVALRRFPDWPQNAAKSAWQLSISQNPWYRVNFWPVCLAEQAVLATGGTQSQYLDVLAAAYANAELFDEATTAARQAIELARKDGQTAFVATVRKRLELYEKKQPYRE